MHLQDRWLVFGCDSCTKCLLAHRTPVDIQPQITHIGPGVISTEMIFVLCVVVSGEYGIGDSTVA